MKRILPLREREKLIQRHCKERDGRIRDRIKLFLLMTMATAYSEIAKILLLDDETKKND